MQEQKWISPREYKKETGLGIETIKQMVKEKKIVGEITEGGHYKILSKQGDTVPRIEYEKTLKELEKYKTIVNIVHNTTMYIE